MTVEQRYDKICKLKETPFNDEQYEAELWDFSKQCRLVLLNHTDRYDRKAVDTFPFWPDPDIVGVECCCAWWLGSWEMWERIFPEENEKLFQETLE